MPPSRVTYVLARPAAGTAPAAPSYTGPTAAQQAQTVLGPQLAQQDTYAAHQNAVIQSFARSLLGKLQPVAKQVGGDYNQAIQQIGGLSGQAAQYLSGQNPTPMQQALTSSVGAPPEQQAQEAAQLGNVFRGGAGVLGFQQGVVPGAELAGNKAAAMAQARQLPGIAALKGQQDLASALWQQSTDRQKLEATRPQLVSDAQQNIDTAVNRAATLAQGQARLDETQRQFAITEGDKAAARKQSAQEFNIGEGDKARTAALQAARLNKPTYYNDSFGRRVQVGPDGSQTIVSTGKTTDANGAVYQVGMDGKLSLLTPGRPAKTPAPPKITRDPNTGAYFKENPDGSLTKVYQGGAPPAKTSGGFTIGNVRYNADGTVLRVGPKAAPSTSAPSTKTINGVTYEWDAGRRGWVRSGLPVAAAKTPSATAPTVHGDRQWDPVKKRWVKAPGLPAKTGTKGKTLSLHEVQQDTAAINDGLNLAINGGNYDKSGNVSPGGGYDKDGFPKPPIDRATAIAELRAAGYFSNPQSAKIAMAAVNRAYPTGKTVRSKGPLGVTATFSP